MRAPVATAGGTARPRNPTWWVTVVIFVGYCLYLPFSGYPELVYDALGYWTLTERFFRDGQFHLLAYDDALRGYLLPLLNLPAKAVCHFTGLPPLALTRLQGAACAALLFGWAAPGLWQQLMPRQQLGWAPRLAFAALGFIFWRDYFNFSLSDFPALLALVITLRLALQPHRNWAVVLAGGALAAASNIRPVYLVALPLVLVLAWVAAPDARRRRWVMAGLTLGFGLVSGPQLALNVRHHQAWTPLVLSRDARFPTANLYLAQLGWGLVIQKYETSLDPAFPAPRMLYTDPAGQELLRRRALRHFRSYGQYAASVAREPLTVAGIYARHVFNGLDVQYPTPFVPVVARRSPLAAALQYLIWFGALVVVGARLFAGRGKLAWMPVLAALALLMPCLAALPMAVECRFLLPAHLLLYALVCFGGQQVNWRAVLGSGRNRVLVLLAGAGFVLLCFRQSAATRAQLTADLSVLAPLGGAEAQE